MDEASQAAALRLPRILCLHGGGTNARIFRAQCRTISSLLQPHFRLVFAEAPFPSHAGPDVLAVYQDWGPFRAWFQWHPDEPERDVDAHRTAIWARLRAAMRDDDQQGGRGEWIAVLGFSQGAKLAASLLLLEQRLREHPHLHARLPAGGRLPPFRFAVLIAGRPPVVDLLPPAEAQPALLHLPTIHVHGLLDPGLRLHRQLLAQCCEKGSTRLVEWQGNHRLPIKTGDAAAVVQAILATAADAGLAEASAFAARSSSALPEAGRFAREDTIRRPDAPGPV
ncbi:serine hydrolase-domain-containing protein [Macrophomina phaseolina]|uniref:Serine hydrolase-domain-containing protein n=1 Tax=Macrophomina phaseolina TaxID=35725 RepID=A0ABQ8GIL1_9PEZI|nr:serine hydrolase-domain-containing protein [Macrophomina phaseolina]